MNRQPIRKQFLRILTLSLVIILFGSGVAILFQWHLGATSGHATSSDNVVGPPSLPASLVDTVFRELGSPMAGTGQAIEAASRAANIDDAFALAVWWTETNDGEAGVGLHDLNPGSVRGSVGYPSAYDGYTIYPSFTAAVNYWFSMMKNVYIDRGLTTVYSIAPPYVGTSTSYLWADKVTALMERYRAEAPPPTPEAKPSPTASTGMKRIGKILAQQEQQQNVGSVPIATPEPQQNTQQANTSAVSSLASNAQPILVLFGLLLLLATGLWIWRKSGRRSASKVQTQNTVLPVSDVWEQLRASQQRPAAFLSSLSEQLRVTEDLAASTPATDELVMTGTLPLPAYHSSALRPSALNAFPPGQMPFPEPQIPHSAFTGQLSGFDVPQPKYPQTGGLPAPGLSLPGLPSQPASQQSSNRSWSPQPETGRLQQLQPVGVRAGGGRSGGLLSRYREMQAYGERV